jgi:hypothetical protein
VNVGTDVSVGRGVKVAVGTCVCVGYGEGVDTTIEILGVAVGVALDVEAQETANIESIKMVETLYVLILIAPRRCASRLQRHDAKLVVSRPYVGKHTNLGGFPTPNVGKHRFGCANAETTSIIVPAFFVSYSTFSKIPAAPNDKSSQGNIGQS